LNFPLGKTTSRLSQNETKLDIASLEFPNYVDMIFPSFFSNFLSFYEIVSCRNHSNENVSYSLIDVPAIV
jgi:hypothetical protein